jgi:hypothetical protein
VHPSLGILERTDEVFMSSAIELSPQERLDLAVQLGARDLQRMSDFYRAHGRLAQADEIDKAIDDLDNRRVS